MVCVERIAVGSTVVSIPIAERTGRAIVVEHLPKHEISWIVRILFIFPLLLPP